MAQLKVTGWVHGHVFGYKQLLEIVKSLRQEWRTETSTLPISWLVTFLYNDLLHNMVGNGTAWCVTVSWQSYGLYMMWMVINHCLLPFIFYLWTMHEIHNKWVKIKFLRSLKVSKFSLGNNHMTVSLPLLHHTIRHLNLPKTGTPAEHKSCSASPLRHVWSSICFSISNAQ